MYFFQNKISILIKISGISEFPDEIMLIFIYKIIFIWTNKIIHRGIILISVFFLGGGKGGLQSFLP